VSAPSPGDPDERSLSHRQGTSGQDRMSNLRALAKVWPTVDYR